MRRLLLIMSSTVLLAAANVAAAAAAVPPLQPASDDLLMAINGPSARAEFDARRHERSFAFVVSAGDSVSIDVDSSTFADACSVDLQVLDSANRVVAQQPCASRRGQVTTLHAASAGTYRMRLLARTERAAAVSVALRGDSAPVQTLPLACVQAALPLDTEASATWDAGCASVSRPGHNAQYYTIAVPQDEVITISLGSTTDSYLVLRAGATPNGAFVADNDNNGPGTDALIARNLPAGTYTIEATTALPGQVGNFTVAARTNSAPCFATLTPNRTVRSSWIETCASIASNDHYARYFALSVPSDEVVTISATSSADNRLVLRSGPTQLGAFVTDDDNDGSGSNAQIVRDLPAGQYTVEATTATPGTLGRFSIVARTNDRPCFLPLALDVTASSKWTKSCTSVIYADTYAKYYVINVPTRQVVTISLRSAINAQMVLRAGDSQLGAFVDTGDDDGPGTDARIVRTLDPGSYTIEATTTGPNQLGDFELTARTNTAPCFAAVALDSVTAGAWSTDCSSVFFADDRYAKYYTLEVPNEQTVSILLQSATNAYLVLRAGNTQLGAFVAGDDNTGGDLNAKITRVLPAGVYTIEATTALPGELGSFVLTIAP